MLPSTKRPLVGLRVYLALEPLWCGDPFFNKKLTHVIFGYPFGAPYQNKTWGNHSVVDVSCLDASPGSRVSVLCHVMGWPHLCSQLSLFWVVS